MLECPEVSRKEHVAWCKTRALEYVDTGDTSGAFASMTSDLRKHPETKDHPGIQLGAMLLFAGHLSSEAKMRDYIDGFN